MEKSKPGLVFPKVTMKEETQEALLREAGAQHIVRVGGSWRSLFQGVRVIREGDTVYFVALVFVPTMRGDDDLPPTVQAAEFVHELERTGAVGIELMDAITDPDHGWPSNHTSGSYWRNSGDTRRLHPLKRPG